MTICATADEALAGMPQLAPDLVLIDLPGDEGLLVLPKLRALTDAGIVVCQERPDRVGSILALRTDADDVVLKPIWIDEFEQRLLAILRRVELSRAAHRPKPGANDPVVVDELTLLPAWGDATIRDTRLNLTRIEYRIVEILARAPGVVRPRQELGRMVWGFEDHNMGHLVDVHVGRIRTKLRSAQTSSPVIVTVRDRGFVLQSAHVSKGDPA